MAGDLAFIHTGITNAGSEGTKGVIKTVARDTYGFRNPVDQRLRTRCATTRRAGGHLDRGAVHFHALVRLDGVDPDDPTAVVPPPAGFAVADLEDALRHAAEQVRFDTPGHPDRPEGWPIAWGEQVDRLCQLSIKWALAFERTRQPTVLGEGFAGL